MPDRRNGNVLTHAGAHYGGSAQRVVNFADSDDRLLRIRKAREEANTQNASRSQTGKITVIDVEKVEIKWTPIAQERYFEANARDILDAIVRENLAQKAWKYKAVYGKFSKDLRSVIKSLGDGPSRFLVIESGKSLVTNGGVKELGTFIKVWITGKEFILPESFTRDCSRAITKKYP